MCTENITNSPCPQSRPEKPKEPSFFGWPAGVSATDEETHAYLYAIFDYLRYLEDLIRSKS